MPEATTILSSDNPSSRMVNYSLQYYRKYKFMKEDFMLRGRILKNCATVSIVALGLLHTSAARAFLAAELSAGKSSATWNGRSGSIPLSATTISMAGHLDPIPLVPISFGLRAYSDTYQDKTQFKLKSSGRYAPEIMAWLPLGDITPFARLGYLASSRYTESTTASSGSNTADMDFSWRGAGPTMGVGIKYSFLPLIQLMATYERATENLTFDSAKVTSGTAIDYDWKATAKNFTLRTTSILIGISAGI
jgi:hypothetical protein